MPYKYTWSATDQYGLKMIKEVEAETAQEAKEILLANGYSNLELKVDDIMAIAQKGFPENVTVLGEEVKVTAQQRVHSMENPKATTWDILKPLLSQGKTLYLILIALAGFQAYRGHYVSVGLIIVALFLWFAFVIILALPQIYYRKLIEAADWSRWNEILSLVAALKNIGKINIIKIPDSELTRYRAKAFAGLGNIQQALDEYRKCEGRPDCPAWLYKLFVAGLYTTAKQYDKAIEFNLASIAENPGSTGWLDLAYRYARYKRDPAKAREAAAESDKNPISEVGKPFRARCLGVIAYLEGDYATAKTELESGISAVENVKYRPFKDGHLAISRAYLCCVLAKQGDLQAAKKNLDLAREYLIATDEDELLAECRHLIGEK